MSDEPALTDIDPGILPAVRALLAHPGVRPRASCQGRGVEIATHAEFAYVLLESPMPIGLEEQLVAHIGGVAHIEPLGVHSRWPARNAEFADALRTAVRDAPHPALVFRAPRGEWEATILEAEAGLHSWAVDWLGDRARLVVATKAPVRGQRIFEGAASESRAAIEAFVAAQDAIDPRILEREGHAAIAARIESGDFGRSTRGAWHGHREARRREQLEDALRTAVSAHRAREGSAAALDLWFEPGSICFGASTRRG